MEVRGILAALSRGAEVIWEPPERPRIRTPEGVSDLLRQDMGATREVLRRAVIFRGQLEEFSPAPLLVLPEGVKSESGCISCGAEIPEVKIRCPLCQTAAWIALDLTPSNVEEWA